MRRVLLLALAILAAGSLALAGNGVDVNRLAGVYKHSFKNGTVDGSAYTSQDILEIVKTAPGEAYIRAHLEFFNGHSCDVQGIARQEHGELVYHPKNRDLEGACTLTLSMADGKLVFHDPDEGCTHNYCGARGNFDGESFDLSARKPIRYMARLRSSWEFKAAQAERMQRP